MTATALQVADTDWHVERLYDFASGLGASIIQPHTSRYAIDLNRPPDNAELYPGANGTELCPTSSFAEEPLYRDGAEPDSAEVTRRLDTFWHPYHQQLQAELARLKSAHGIAVLFEAHSIRSVVPRLFDGRLPDVNIGTASGSSCAPAMLAAVETLLAEQTTYTYVINQRFKGGYITRAYGNPHAGVHSLQLELSQRTYMEEQPPFHYRPDLAAQVQPLLRQLVQSLIDWARQEARQA
jgi:N-formylglutamate deformylase